MASLTHTQFAPEDDCWEWPRSVGLSPLVTNRRGESRKEDGCRIKELRTRETFLRACGLIISRDLRQSFSGYSPCKNVFRRSLVAGITMSLSRCAVIAVLLGVFLGSAGPAHAAAA